MTRTSQGDMARRSFVKAGAAALATAATVGAVLTAKESSNEKDGKEDLVVRRLGWAGISIRLGDVTVVVDPLANEKLWGLDLGRLLVPIEIETGGRHALVTHLHGDHFDPGALEAVLGERGQVACSEKQAVAISSRGFRVRPLRLFEPTLLGGLVALSVPASDGFGIDQVSWIVSGAGRRIIHCGDTLWHGSWWEVGKQYGPFDAAFLPINGFRFQGRDPDVDVPSSLTPEQAAAAASVLGARKIVPIHYGLQAPFYREEADAERRLVASAAGSGVAVEVVAPGRLVTWS